MNPTTTSRNRTILFGEPLCSEYVIPAIGHLPAGRITIWNQPALKRYAASEPTAWLWCGRCQRVFQARELELDRGGRAGPCPLCSRGGLGAGVWPWRAFRGDDWPREERELRRGMWLPPSPTAPTATSSMAPTATSLAPGAATESRRSTRRTSGRPRARTD